MNSCIICQNTSPSLKHKKTNETDFENQFQSFCKILQISKTNARKYLSQFEWKEQFSSPFCGICTQLTKDLIYFNSQQIQLEEEVLHLQNSLCNKLKELTKTIQNLDKVFNNLREKFPATSNEQAESQKFTKESNSSSKTLPKPNLKEISSIKRSFTAAFHAAAATRPEISNRKYVSSYKRKRKLLKEYPTNFITIQSKTSENKGKISEFEENFSFPNENDELEAEIEIKQEYENEYEIDSEAEIDNAFRIGSPETDQINLLNCMDIKEEDDDVPFLQDPLLLDNGNKSDSDVSNQNVAEYANRDSDSDSADEWKIPSRKKKKTNLRKTILKKKTKKSKPKSHHKKRKTKNIPIEQEYVPIEQAEKLNDNESETCLRPRRSCTKSKSYKISKKDSEASDTSSSSEENSDADDNSNASDWSETHKEVIEEENNKLNAIQAEIEAKKLEQYKWLGDLDLTTTPGKIFFNEVEIIEKEKEKKSFECSMCGHLDTTMSTERFSLQVATIRIRKHIMEEHFGGFRCQICLQTKKFKSYHLLSIHIKLHDQATIECEFCGMIFKSSYGSKLIDFHRWTHKNEQEKAEAIASGVIPPSAPKRFYKRNHLCVQCGKKYESPNALARHETTHLDPEEREKSKIPCNHCGKLYLRDSLRLHIKYMHNRETMRRYACKFCDDSFVIPSRLTAHIRLVHTKERPFKCTYEGCKLDFTTVGNLNEHIKRHTGKIKVRSCPFCSYTCIKNLDRHVKNVHGKNNNKTSSKTATSSNEQELSTIQKQNHQVVNEVVEGLSTNAVVYNSGSETIPLSMSLNNSAFVSVSSAVYQDPSYNAQWF